MKAVAGNIGEMAVRATPYTAARSSALELRQNPASCLAGKVQPGLPARIARNRNRKPAGERKANYIPQSYTGRVYCPNNPNSNPLQVVDSARAERAGLYVPE